MLHSVKSTRQKHREKQNKIEKQIPTFFKGRGFIIGAGEQI